MTFWNSTIIIMIVIYLKLYYYGHRELRRAQGQTFCFRKIFDISWKTFPILPFPGKNFWFSSAQISDDLFLVIDQNFEFFPIFSLSYYFFHHEFYENCPIYHKFLSLCPFSLLSQFFTIPGPCVCVGGYWIQVEETKESGNFLLTVNM